MTMSLEKVIQRYQAHKDADAAVNEHTSGTEVFFQIPISYQIVLNSYFQMIMLLQTPTLHTLNPFLFTMLPLLRTVDSFTAPKKLLPAWRTPDAGSDLLLSVQRHVEAKTVVQLDLTQVTQLVRNLESLLREAQVRKEIPLPPENLLMENELSSIANQQNQSQNQQHEQDLDDIPNPNQQQQQFLLMGMHLNNSNNGGVGDSSVIPIHQLQHHQQNQPFLMGMNLNHNNFPTTDDNNNISNGGAGSGPSAAASLLQRDAFQKDILHFF
ncbi:unnamed protein product [Linum tenue]|uniref:Uncharacterized protein n=1 Tax=Linum tenue TaxID=586396 RepID=A0AAV0RG60_9ROSI|nr:unnamed protein product [Linum tenue]